MGTFCALVVTWNSADEVATLLDSAAVHLPEQPEWIFVDNASSDGTIDEIERRRPEATIIRLPENRGFGAANNIGLRRATSDVVVLLNPDVVLVDDSLAELARFARHGALVGPRLLDEDGGKQISAHPPVGSWELLPLALLPVGVMPTALKRRCVPWRLNERLDVGWLSGACLAGRRDVLSRLGPFDERLHLYGEDIDLGLRAHAAGVRCVFAPDLARVVHAGSRSTVQRFDDAGVARKLEARRWVCRERLHPVRAAWDLGCEIMLYGSRRTAKGLLRRPADYERFWFGGLR